MRERTFPEKVSAKILTALLALVLSTVVFAGEDEPAKHDPDHYQKLEEAIASGKAPKIGKVYRLNPFSAHPSQFVVGMEEVRTRAKEIAEKSSDELSHYLQKKVGGVIVGPARVLWLVDGHHLATALTQLEKDTMLVRVEEDWSALSDAEFQNKMESGNHAWLYDAENKLRPFGELPARVSALQDDPFRSLAWKVANHGGFKETNVEFQEFLWAQFFRKHLPSELLKDDPKKALTEAMKLATSSEAAALPGFTGKILCTKAVEQSLESLAVPRANQ